MPRLARVVIPGMPHHVTQRGNRREPVFFEPGDRAWYLHLLAHYADLHGLEIWAYCLMTNHVHLVAVPSTEASLGQSLRDAHGAYSSYLNRRINVTGHLWQGRFYSTVLEGPHMWSAVRYVERNPVRAAIVQRAEEYAWSSAAVHCGLRGNQGQHPAMGMGTDAGAVVVPGVCPHSQKRGQTPTTTIASVSVPISSVPVVPACRAPASEGLPQGELERDGHIADWRLWLMAEDQAELELIRERTRTGRPCGSVEFVSRLEGVVGRRLATWAQKRRRTST